MRSSFTVIIFCVFLISLGFAVDAWHTEVVTQVPSTEQITGTALGFFTTGMPCIVFCEHSSSFDYLRIARWNGYNWQFEQVNTSGRLGINLDMAIDNANQPCITCLDGSNNVVYVHKSGSTWQTEVVETAGSPYPSIALDQQYRPHLAYFRQPQNELRYAWLNGSTWQISTVDASSTGSYSSIDMDSSGNPAIAYVGTGNLKYAKLNGTVWNIEDVDLMNNSFHPVEPVLCLDSLNLPHIAYKYVMTTPYTLKYATYTGSTWNIEGLTFYNDEGYYPAMALDSQDHPHISHASNDQTYQVLLYFTYTGAYWQYTTPCMMGDVGDYTSIAINSIDHASISHASNVHEHRLFYTWFGNANIGVETADFRATTADRGIKLEWDVSADLLSDMIGFNLYRSQAGKTDKKSWSRLNSNLIMGNNPYSYLDATCKSGQSYRYRLTAIKSDGREEELGNTSGQAGILDRGFSLLAVYPNPAQLLLTCRLFLPQAGIVSLKLYDTSGRLVLEKRLDLLAGEQTSSVDVSRLATGIYCLQANSNNEIRYKRIVVIR